MDILQLKPADGAIKKRKIVGRGPGSGHGKTSTRGHKGQNARKGGGVRPGFEGGQTPLYRRIPKKGFSNARFKKEYAEINLYLLDKKFEDSDVIKPEDLEKKGLLKTKLKLVKILGNGEIKKKLTVYAHKFSLKAKEKIEKAGGQAIVIEENNENK